MTNDDDMSLHLTPDTRSLLESLVENLEEVRPQMPEVPKDTTEMVELILNGEAMFGDQYTAMEMGVAAGRICAIAAALRCSESALLAALPTS